MIRLSTSRKDVLDKLLSDAVQSGKIPGLCFGATDANSELYFGTAGIRVVNDPSAGEVTGDSVFWICSQTKMIVSLAALILVENEKLSLDTPVATILPELSNAVVVDDPMADVITYKPAKNTITLAHLLNHSSGIFYEVKRDPPHALPFPYISSHEKQDSVPRWYGLARGNLPAIPLKFEPGTDFAYGYNIDAVGFIVERISGLSLEDYCKRFIFTPLNMTSTSFYLTPELEQRSVMLAFRHPDGTLRRFDNEIGVTPQRYGEVHVHLGGIGLQSSMKDYLALLRHLLQIHAGTALNPILNTEAVKSLFRPTLTEKGVGSVNAFTKMTDGQWSTGLCLNTTDWPGRRRKFSGWWFGWAGTFHFIDPTTGIGAVFGTQVIPTRDADVWALWPKLEAALYSAIVDEQ